MQSTKVLTFRQELEMRYTEDVVIAAMITYKNLTQQKWFRLWYVCERLVTNHLMANASRLETPVETRVVPANGHRLEWPPLAPWPQRHLSVTSVRPQRTQTHPTELTLGSNILGFLERWRGEEQILTMQRWCKDNAKTMHRRYRDEEAKREESDNYLTKLIQIRIKQNCN